MLLRNVQLSTLSENNILKALRMEMNTFLVGEIISIESISDSIATRSHHRDKKNWEAGALWETENYCVNLSVSSLSFAAVKILINFILSSGSLSVKKKFMHSY